MNSDGTIDALELLRMQHEEIESLIDDIEVANVPDTKRELFVELADKLAAHSSVEETIFYPAVMDAGTRELLLESAEEHLSVKRILADMLALDVEDEYFDAKLTVIKEQIRHHAHDGEEALLFPRVKRLMSTDQLAGLGNEMFATYVSLLERSPRDQVLAETEEAAQLP